MEENPSPTPSTSSDPPVVEEPQDRHRAKARVPSEFPAGDSAEMNSNEAAESSAEAAGPISVDELLKEDASGEAGPEISSVDLLRAASILESLLLVSSEPLSVEKARQILGDLTRERFEEVFLALREKYPPESSGILVEKVAKGVQFRTNPANQEHVRKLFDVKPPRFSRAALETVAIIAYKQPLTRQEIEQIRGVDCAGSLKTLMERRLVRVVGKKDVPGKPFLFGTTREFMEVFGLGSLGELPSMREIEEYLSSSAATPVDVGRPGLELPFADAETTDGVEEGDADMSAEMNTEMGADTVAPEPDAAPEADSPEADPDAH
ncbi:MAG: SMC-Scp complex subunit ScpB [Deltaproteobacteria bacterium]|nr:SMC-Scp complex subunit ScpB [Deltaproteobacteria bacterium]